jgi:hypothetical protein
MPTALQNLVPNRVRYGKDDHRPDTFLSQVVRSGRAIPKGRIEALTLLGRCM